jgi:hypothetical protein
MSSSYTAEKYNKMNLRQVYALAFAAIIISGLLLATIQSPVFAQSRSSIQTGVLAYTHGDMRNEPGSPTMDKMTSIEQRLERVFKTPTEIVFHMPYNWDKGLEKLDQQGVKYAIFLYTDMFGPQSTVIHDVTRGVFGGIEEYNNCPGVPLDQGGCLYMGQATYPASLSSSTVLVFAEPARPDHPILREIFLKQTRAVSDSPRNEILVLLGHGARADSNDNAQKMELSRAAEYVEKRMRFADSAAFTAREDWPELAPAAIEEAVSQIKNMLEQTGAENVILVPATTHSGFHMVAEALEEEGVPFTEAPNPLPTDKSDFIRWAQQTVGETIKFIAKEKPTESTITPQWNRNYQ